MSEILNLNFLKNFFAKGDERSTRAKNNILASFICRGLNILIGFLVVPITFGYVGKVEFGIWMTISSIIQWFGYFDIGLGNGLRNKLAESLALNDTKTARIYVSSVFAIITMIATLMFVIFFIASKFISWNSVLNTDLISNEKLFETIIMVFFFFCIGFVTNLISSILQAIQKNALNDILLLIAQVLGLIGMFILTKTTEGSLFKMCLIYSSKATIVMVIASFILFATSLKEYKPSLKYIQLKKATPLLNLGMKFFVNQILYLLATQTSVILVVQFFGPEDVTVYNLALRYVSIASMGYIMILTPFLSAFTEAYTKKEFGWIKKTINRINLIWLLTSIATVIMIFGSSIFFHLWIGDKLTIPISLIIAMAVSSIIGTWSATYSLFLNGIGKITLQFFILLVQAVLFFPLTYFFYKLNFGLIALVSTQIIFGILSSYFMYHQYKKIIANTATGIWNR